MAVVTFTPKIDNLEHFLAECDLRHHPSKSMIISAGQPCESLFFILQGTVTIVLEPSPNKEIIVSYLNQGNFFGEMGLFNNSKTTARRSAGVRAKTACDIAEISYVKFRQLIQQYPDILYALSSQMSDCLRNTSRKVGDLAFLDSTGRVAHALLNLAKHADALTHPKGMQIKISRQELGHIAGCSREMAGRVLKNLEEQGLINVQGQTIVVFGTRE